ncbi:MAG: prenyltransferase [Candidatus Thermoplasmatota archaeon]|nr:prenyltransferase [Candidatus Thermoplasmatota archaeon]MCL5253131.1 prenyltransferase [Candidatus Thermoplasmatota archaeon]
MTKPGVVIRGLRIPMYWASGGPILITAALALSRGEMKFPVLFTLGAAALLIFEMGVNIMAEIADNAESVMITQEETWIPTGPYLVKYGGKSAEQLTGYGIFTLLLAGIIGLYIAASTGFVVIILIGMSGLAMTFIYAFPPMELGLRGFGEPVAFFSFGPLPMLALYYIASDHISALPIIFSLPTAFWVTSIRYAHHLPDAGMRRGARYAAAHAFRLKHAMAFITLFSMLALASVASLVIIAGYSMLVPLVFSLLLTAYILLVVRRNCSDATCFSRQTAHLLLLQFAGTVLIAAALLAAH